MSGALIGAAKVGSPFGGRIGWRHKILFDTNAIRYLFVRDGFSDDQLRRIRDRLQHHAALGDIRPVLTTPVGWELAGFAHKLDVGPERCREMLRFYVTIGSQWVLKNEYERMRLELLRKRKLRDVEVFDACDIETTLATFAREEGRNRENAEWLQELKAKEREEEPAKREATVVALAEFFGDDWKRDLSSADWAALVKKFVKTEMRAFAKQQRLGLVGNAWPKARDVPTFWYSESFYAAKIRRVFVESQKDLTTKKSLADVPDMVDATHFRDAAYVDCLVTQDRVFAEVAEAARVPLTILTFDDFAREVLVSC